MQAALRPYATAGVALVGASVIAVSPVTVPPAAIEQVRDSAVQLAASVDPLEVFRQVLQQTITNARATGQAILDNPAPILPQLIKNQLGQALQLPANIVRQIDLLPDLPGLLAQTTASELADLGALGQVSQEFLANIVAAITQGDVQGQLQQALDAARGGDFGTAFNLLSGVPLVLLIGHQFGNLLRIRSWSAS